MRRRIGRYQSDVFTFNGLLAPEQRVFVRFAEGQLKNRIAAFFPDLFRDFLIVFCQLKNRLGDFR